MLVIPDALVHLAMVAGCWDAGKCSLLRKQQQVASGIPQHNQRSRCGIQLCMLTSGRLHISFVPWERLSQTSCVVNKIGIS